MPTLFMTCFECQIEKKVIDNYGENNFFLSTLGSLFDFEDFKYVERINWFLDSKSISKICIVNTTSCTLLNQCFFKEINCHNYVSDIFKLLYLHNQALFEKLLTVEEKVLKLAELNIKRQVFEFIKAPFICTKIRDGKLIPKGLIYTHEQNEFLEIELSLFSENNLKSYRLNH